MTTEELKESTLEEIHEEEKWESKFIDEIKEVMDKYNINIGLLIAQHPETEDMLLTCTIGPKLEAAAYAASFVREIRQQINNRLAT